MMLPFTLEQFLDVFASYNRALWPAALLLWLASLGAVVLVVRRDPRTTRVVAGLLTIHWAWSGVAYHLAYFRSINPVALLFGVLFVVQAGFFLWWAFRAPPTGFHLQAGRWSRVGLAFMAYALVYPALGLAFGLSYPRMPTFGVPCPTTLFTVGALLVARSSAPRWLGLIPLAWTVVGGSAAFLIGVRADLALPVSGAVLLVSMVLPLHGSRASVIVA
jgi:hypothetical protein